MALSKIWSLMILSLLLAVVLHFGGILSRAPEVSAVTSKDSSESGNVDSVIDASSTTAYIVAGSGKYGVAKTGFLAAKNTPVKKLRSVFVDSVGDLYFSEEWGQCISKLSLTDMIVWHVAGICDDRLLNFNGDYVPATSASIWPLGMMGDSNGVLYVADNGNDRVRAVSNGFVATVDACTSHGVGGPDGLWVTTDGRIYITTDTLFIKCIYDGRVTTVAGTGSDGFRGDGGPATSASLNAIQVTIDSNGVMYFTDLNNFRVRMISASGIIQTFAGSGSGESSMDELPRTSFALQPFGIAIHPISGDVYVSVQNGIVVANSHKDSMKVVPVIGEADSFGRTSLWPERMFLDAPSDNLYFSDAGEYVRKISLAEKK